MTYDQQSYDLAAHFLADEPKLNTERNRVRLAREIQASVEDWIAYERTDPLPEQQARTPPPRVPFDQMTDREWYDYATANHSTIHGNRFAGWDELSVHARREWIAKHPRPHGPAKKGGA